MNGPLFIRWRLPASLGAGILLVPLGAAGQFLSPGKPEFTLSNPRSSITKGEDGVVVAFDVSPTPKPAGDNAVHICIVAEQGTATQTIDKLIVSGGSYNATVAGDGRLYFTSNLSAAGQYLGPLLIQELSTADIQAKSVRFRIDHFTSIVPKEEFPTSGRFQLALGGRGPKDGETFLLLVSNVVRLEV